jgi:hypothetical protein
VGCNRASVKAVAELVVLGSPVAYCFYDSNALCPWSPAVAVVWALAVDVDLPLGKCWWSVGGIRLVGSLNLVHNSNSDVIRSAGVPVFDYRSQCYSRSATKVVLVDWSEEKQASRRHLHRPGWRCVDRLAIARDSGHQTCCAAEANAGGQRCGEEIVGWVGERAKGVAEHGVVGVCGDCIARVGVAAAAAGGGATARNSAADSSGGGGVGSGAEGGNWCFVSDSGGCNAMQWVLVRVLCMAVYIRVDRRAQCDVVLTSMLAVLLLARFHFQLIKSPLPRSALPEP